MASLHHSLDEYASTPKELWDHLAKKGVGVQDVWRSIVQKLYEAIRGETA